MPNSHHREFHNYCRLLKKKDKMNTYTVPSTRQRRSLNHRSSTSSSSYSSLLKINFEFNFEVTRPTICEEKYVYGCFHPLLQWDFKYISLKGP